MKRMEVISEKDRSNKKRATTVRKGERVHAKMDGGTAGSH